MASNTEVAKAIIDVDGKVAGDKLKELTKQARAFRKEMEEAKLKGDNASFQKFKGQLDTTTKEIDKMKRSSFELNKVLGNLSGSSVKELERAHKQLTNEIRNGSRASEAERAELKRKADQLRQVDAELTKVRQEMALTRVSSQSFMSQLANGLNKYFLAATAAVASFASVIFGAKKAISTFAEWDDKLADVQKTTGLTKDQVKGLNEEFKEIDTRSAQLELLDLARVAGKLGITAAKDVEGFVKAADKIKVALSEDLGGDVEESINQVGKLVDIFGIKKEFGIEESMIKTGSAINALGAASTANEGYLVEFTQRVAGVAPSAKISMANVLGLAATLDQFGQQTEMSATVVNKVITDMMSKPGEYAKVAGVELTKFKDLLNKDANEALLQFLDGLNGNNQGMEYMAKMFSTLGLDGTRAISVLGVLSNNVETLRKQQQLSNVEFDKGTSIINEFNTKNTTMQAKLEKARKDLYNVTVELGERLAPALQVSTSGLSYLVRGMNESIKFFVEYKGIIIPTVSALALYSAAVNAAAIKKGIFTAATKVATVATRAFSFAVGKSPWGLALTALTALTSAFFYFRNRVDDSTEKMKEFNNTVNESVAESNVLFDQLKKTAAGTDERRAAIAKLREIHGEYLKDLNLEQTSLAEIERIQKGANDELVRKIALEAQNKDLTVWYKKEIEIKKRIAELGFNVEEIMKERSTPYNGKGKFVFTTYGTEVDNLLMNLDVVEKEIGRVRDLYSRITSDLTTPFAGGSGSGDGGGGGGIPDVTGAFEALTKKIAEAQKQMMDFAASGNLAEALQTQKVVNELEAAKEAIEYLIKAKGDVGKMLDDIKGSFLEDYISNIKTPKPLDNEGTISPDPIKNNLKPIEKDIFGNAVGLESDEDKGDDAKGDWMIEQAEVVSDAVFSIWSNKQDARFEREMSQLDAQMEKELSNKKLTEDQKDKIRDKYAKKERKLKQEQFKKQKGADIIQSIINTALAVVKALPDMPLAIATGIAGLAQTAVIASQPVPQFYAGGDTGEGIGVKDNSNRQIAGVVHPREYVIPEWMRGLPQVIAFERVMEGIRTGRPGYVDGGSVNGAQGSGTSPLPSPQGEGAQLALLAAINKFNSIIENGISGKWVYQDFKEFTDKVEKAELMAQS